MGGSANNVLYIALHRMDAFGEVDIRFGIHLGSFSQTSTSADITGGLDAWAYARGQSSRNSTYDTKMGNVFGADYTQISTAFKDSLWTYMHTYQPPR